MEVVRVRDVDALNGEEEVGSVVEVDVDEDADVEVSARAAAANAATSVASTWRERAGGPI